MADRKRKMQHREHGGWLDEEPRFDMQTDAAPRRMHALPDGPLWENGPPILVWFEYMQSGLAVFSSEFSCFDVYAGLETPAPGRWQIDLHVLQLSACGVWIRPDCRLQEILKDRCQLLWDKRQKRV